MVDTTKESHQVLHAFDLNPRVKFEEQLADENIILLLRAHPITLIPYILNALMLLLLLLFLIFFFSSVLSAAQLFFAILFVFVFVLSYLWLTFLIYFFSVGIITNLRIVDIDFHSVLYKETTATRLDRVEDTTSKISGYFASIFNYGDVFVQTAGTEVNIEFLKIPKPTDVVSIINGLLEDR